MLESANVDDSNEATDDSRRSRERRWAWVRLVLGLLQMSGAVVSLCLLVQTGTSELTIASFAMTALFTAISVFLFRFRRSNIPWADQQEGESQPDDEQHS